MTADRPQDATWDGHCERCDWPHHAEDGPVCRNCECMWNEKSELRARLSVVEAENARIAKALGDVLDEIQSSRLASIGSIHTHYTPQIRRESVERWRDILSAPPSGSPPNE